MTDKQLLRRLPYHAETATPQVQRMLGERVVLGVITEGEAGLNLYPGPRRTA